MRVKNLKKMCAIALFTALLASGLSAREITDNAGRKVNVPDKVNSFYTTSQIGIITLYALNPDKLVGWGFALGDSDKKFINPKYYGLPVLGVWSGKNGTGNVEQIAKVRPDVIFSIGTIEKTMIDQADMIQKQTGIPVVMVNAPLAKLDSSIEFIGSITGDTERAKTLAAYAKKTISAISSALAKVPDDKRVRVYYAEGPDGLQTDPTGSFHTEVLDFARGANVADVLNQGGYGRATVSPEQLYVWQPDVIIVNSDKEGPSGLASSSTWAPVKAVKDGRVYQVPNAPFDWFDRPPSVNRLIGTWWLANILYPDQVKIDIVAETKKFYSLFYWYDLSDDEAKALLRQKAGTPK